uniref:Uncharacterized protein n=1 Tax=Anguilla anguilla TaxID=7936 RepID=A0A0E9X319_ANGAN
MLCKCILITKMVQVTDKNKKNSYQCRTVNHLHVVDAEWSISSEKRVLLELRVHYSESVCVCGGGGCQRKKF